MSKTLYTMNKIWNFERRKDYISQLHFSVEDEIREHCKKNRIVVNSIIPFDGYKVVGVRTRSHKECEELQDAVLKTKNIPLVAKGVR